MEDSRGAQSQWEATEKQSATCQQGKPEKEATNKQDI
jgi:hypothetical protein